MALKYVYPGQSWYTQANFLDGISSYSWVGWARIDTLNAGTYQGLWGHQGSTNSIRVQKGNNDQWNANITSGGVLKQVWDTTGTVVQGTVYHVAVTWEKASATGLQIYRNGSWVATTSTATQTSDYNSGGNIDLYLSGVSNNNRVGYCTLEGCAWWINYVLSADEIAALYRVGWPHLVVNTPPALFLPHWGEVDTRIPDLSGNSRHIESSNIDSQVATEIIIGKWENPHQYASGFYRQGAAGPPGPNPWTYWETITHPATDSTVTGLTNDTTYEFKVTALDTSANESTDSDTVEATPYAPTAYVHVPRHVLGGR